MNQPDLSICILNWNGKDFLGDCIASIGDAKLTVSYEILLIDNDSTDGSAEQALQDFPHIRLIKNSDNCGFAKGNNSGIHASKGKYLLLLNPDTLVYPGSLDGMIAFMDQHEDAAICGPRLCHPESKKIETSARAFPRLLPLFWNLTYLDRAFPQSRFFSSYQRTWNSCAEPHEVDWVTGACLMIRRDTIDRIGLLDEDIFMYCEDIDWCFRCKQQGGKVFFLPGIMIGHYRGQSSRQRQKDTGSELGIWGAQQYARSVLYFYAKHYGLLRTVTLRCILVLTSVWKACLWIAKGLVTCTLLQAMGRARSYLSVVPVAFGTIRE